MDAALYPDWPAPAKVRAFTTLRHGAGLSASPFDSFNLGARCGDDAQAVAGNREELIRHFALPSAPRWLQQVHGNEAVRLDHRRPDLSMELEADAAITATSGVVLAILSADCLPVLFSAQDGCEVAIAHAGWRGLAAGVLENTVSTMHTAPDRLLAWLGPAAGPDAYEVGDEVRTALVEREDADSSAFIGTRTGHWLCDLYALARSRLHTMGVTRIHGGGLCTIRDPVRFYSHRRDGVSGRMASVIWLREDDDNA